VARTSAVEYERVAEACSSLFLEGKSPSFESVYELIGRKGGAKVVQGMIADWRKEMANRFMAGRTNPDLPEELITEATRCSPSSGAWRWKSPMPRTPMNEADSTRLASTWLQR
jgi:hypothetical protein